MSTVTPLPLPWSFEAARECVKEYPPAGAFDPARAWEMQYRVWRLAREFPRVAGSTPAGGLRLRRDVACDGTLRISVCQVTNMVNRTAYLADATMICAAGCLATPMLWALQTAILGPDGRALERTICNSGGRASGGQVWLQKGKGHRTLTMAGEFTSSWSLMDAVQRLPRDLGKPIEFDVLEELDLHKPGQRLMYRESVETELAGKTVRLHGFDRTGRGILPTTYWVDEQRRLVMVIGGLRALVLDAGLKMQEPEL